MEQFPPYLYVSMEKNSTKTTETLSEKSVWLLIGLLPIRVKPLNLRQITEVGELALMIEDVKLDMEQLLSTFLFSRGKELPIIEEISLKVLFRERWKRFLFGGYIKKRLTTKQLKKVISILEMSVDYRFFLNSLIFLRGMKMKTKE